MEKGERYEVETPASVQEQAVLPDLQVLGGTRVGFNSGDAAYDTQQEYRTVHVFVPARQLGTKHGGADNMPFEVSLTDMQLSVCVRDQGLYFQGLLWKPVASCTSEWADQELHITLQKAEDSVGMWPHIFQQLDSREGAAPGTPELYAEEAPIRVAAIQAEKQAQHAEFEEAVGNQLGEATAAAAQVAFLFPGQGSQYVGMLQSCKELPSVQKMLAVAKQVLGYDLLEVCMSGPKAKLDDTRFAQPAVFVAGLAAIEKLKAEGGGSAILQASACAGLSSGEYTALVFAGALSFEDALKVVKVRAEAMAKAAKSGDPQGMVSILGMEDDDLYSLCFMAIGQHPGQTCQVASLLYSKCRVISGHRELVTKVAALARDQFGARTVPISASGAFHSVLMTAAQEALTKVLASISFQEPRMPVYSNVTGQPFKNAAEIPKLLADQLCLPVQWEQTLNGLIREGWTSLYELGPGVQIKSMCRRVNEAVSSSMHSIEV
ncbi:hypothetical protein WJX72_004228 [[Myrmecia] bisecta]|uniref:Malonyl-CoA:ACP transacylase (MAT) domain-containing protein n=1 Tax=[Myrmecia] bisecta TaxID=41462 RepID=A0AAW1PSL2_9CHLO